MNTFCHYFLLIKHDKFSVCATISLAVIHSPFASFALKNPTFILHVKNGPTAG